MRRFRIGLLATSITLSLAACGGGGDGPSTPPPNALTGVTVTPASLVVNVGETRTLVPSPASSASGVTVTYQYAPSTGAVTVSSAGVVTAVSQGSGQIVVTATGSGPNVTTNSVTASVPYQVNALPAALTGVTVTPTAPSIGVGGTVQLNPQPTGLGTGAQVSYSYAVAPASIVTVSSTGLVTGVAQGQATITITATGTGAGFQTATATTTSTVTVTSAPLQVAVGPTTAAIAPGTSATAGQSAQITVAPTQVGTGVTLTTTFQSDNPAVATVSGTGLVSALTPGTVNLTVSVRGTGAGYRDTTRVIVIPYAVTAATCTVINATVGTSYTGTLTTADCGNGTRVVELYRFTLPAPRFISAAARGPFSPIVLTGRLDDNFPQIRSLLFGGPTARPDSINIVYLLPAGVSYIAPGTTIAQPGNYTFATQDAPEDVEACREVVAIGTVFTTQRLSANSCDTGGGFRDDVFTIFAPGRSCTIDMQRVAGAGSMADPYLAAVSGPTSQVIAANDDIDATNLDARLTFNSCNDASGNFLRIFAGSSAPNDFGLYRFAVTVGPAPAALLDATPGSGWGSERVDTGFNTRAPVAHRLFPR